MNLNKDIFKSLNDIFNMFKVFLKHNCKRFVYTNVMNVTQGTLNISVASETHKLL